MSPEITELLAWMRAIKAHVPREEWPEFDVAIVLRPIPGGMLCELKA